MLHIHLITLGKLKETYWQEAEAEYLKRLGSFAKITIHELREESFSEKDKPETIKQKEAEKIQKTVEKIPDAFVIALDEHGRQFSSLDFSHQIQTLGEQNSNIIFVIGGPLGLHESVLRLARIKLSFSQLTFTHQMIRVFLLEQIYRAMMITANRKYHY